MSPSSVFVSGLNFEKIRQVMYALRDDIELSQVYFSKFNPETKTEDGLIMLAVLQTNQCDLSQ